MNLPAIRIKCAEIRGHDISHENKPGYMTPWFEGIGFGEDEEPIPNVTESADAALELVAWMEKPENGGWWPTATQNSGRRWLFCLTKWAENFHGEADTFQLALCLAFLRANGIDPETL